MRCNQATCDLARIALPLLSSSTAIGDPISREQRVHVANAVRQTRLPAPALVARDEERVKIFFDGQAQGSRTEFQDIRDYRRVRLFRIRERPLSRRHLRAENQSERRTVATAGSSAIRTLLRKTTAERGINRVDGAWTLAVFPIRKVLAHPRPILPVARSRCTNISRGQREHRVGHPAPEAVVVDELFE